MTRWNSQDLRGLGDLGGLGLPLSPRRQGAKGGGLSWAWELIRREETAGTIEIITGQARKRRKGRVDYTLRVQVSPGTQPIAIALIEAKGREVAEALALLRAT